MKHLVLLLAALVFTPNFAQAKSPEIVEISPNTYVVMIDSLFSSTTKLKTKAIKQVTKFAADKGKTAIPISERASAIPGEHNTYEYQFKLVDPNSPEATSTPIVASADAIVENRNAYSGGLKIQQEADEEPDLYTELLQLDDLRQKGILTDEEFDKQKRKLLDSD